MLLQKFALARDVAAITLGQNVLAHRFDGFAGDDPIADRRLQRYFVHLPGDELLHLFDEQLAAAEGLLLVNDQGECVEGLAIDQDVHLHQVAFAIPDELVIERGISA